MIGCLLTAGLGVALRDDDDPPPVVLESYGSIPEDRFMDSPDPGLPSDGAGPALPNFPSLPKDSGSALAGRTTDGATHGLYGGSGDLSVCDPDRIVAFLTDPANRDKAEAWADAEGIDVDDIADFVAGLTPIRLRYDTRVTNHGFNDGRATPHQSVLQAGTAVLVDARGVPRVKCNCGNPLDEPSGRGSGTFDVEEVAQNPDDAWDGFDPANVVRVEPADDDLQALVLVDYDDGEVLTRPTGTTGDQDRAAAPDDPACTDLGVARSCGGTGEPPPDDDPGPADAVRRYVAALGSGDCQGIIDSLSNGSLDLLQVTRDQGIQNCSQWSADLAAAYAGLTVQKIVAISQSDDTAEVQVTLALGTETFTEPTVLIREDDRWRLDF